MKTHHSPSHYQAVLLQGAWFSAIPLDLRQALLAHAVILPFAAGQAIFSYGDPEQGIYQPRRKTSRL